MDASRIIIEIELGNDAMQTAEDVADAVTRSLIRQSASPHGPLNQHEVGTLRDLNGNTVGKWEVQ